MPEVEPAARLVEMPEASSTTLLGVAVGFIGLLVLAVSIEVARRIRKRYRRIRAEWRTVSQVIEERQLSKDEREFLMEVIARHSSAHPIKAVTLRQHFDKCVEAKMAELDRAGDPHAYEEAGKALRKIRNRLGSDFVPIGPHIHATHELRAGQRVWMAPQEQRPPRWSRGRIVAVDEALFFVSPATDATWENGVPGDIGRFRLWRDEDARYTFTTKLFRVDESPPQWAFHHSRELDRVQSRKYYRVRHEQQTTILVLPLSIKGDTDDLLLRAPVTRLRGRLTSLSAGGAALVAPQDFPKQAHLRFEIQVPDEDPIDAVGRIIRIRPISGGRYLVRMCFVAMDEETKDVIARYVMLRQQLTTAASQ